MFSFVLLTQWKNEPFLPSLSGVILLGLTLCDCSAALFEFSLFPLRVTANQNVSYLNEY